jgi:hypothetical protein
MQAVPHIGPDLGPAFGLVDPNAVALLLFYLIVLLVIIYTLIAGYHWIRFGHRSLATIPALAVHVTVSLALIGYALTGLP